MKLAWILWLAQILPQPAADSLCLSTTLYLEARDQSERGQRAVAEVALRRRDSGLWGDDVCLEASGVGIEAQDGAVAVAGDPRMAVGIHHHRMRRGALGQVVARERLGARVEHRQVVAALADEPDASVRCDGRIAGTGVRPGDGPLPDGRAALGGLHGAERRREWQGTGEQQEPALHRHPPTAWCSEGYAGPAHGRRQARHEGLAK